MPGLPSCDTTRARDRRRLSTCRRTAPPCRISRAPRAPPFQAPLRRRERRPYGTRLAAGFGDGGGDDRAVAVIDAGRPQRLARLHQFIAGRQHRHLRPPHHVDAAEPAGRQHADLARADTRATAQQGLAARDVGAGIGDELSRRAPRGALRCAAPPSSISSVCSIITTASAPRGITPPVAIAVAVPGATLELRRMAAGDHLGVEREQPSALASLGAHSIGRAHARSRRHWSGRTAAHRPAATTSCASTRPSASASGNVLGRQAASDRDAARSARAPPRPKRLRGIAPGARPRARARSARRLPAGLRSAWSSWPRPYLNGRAGGISLAVGRHQDPAVRPRQRLTAADISRASGSAWPASTRAPARLRPVPRSR